MRSLAAAFTTLPLLAIAPAFALAQTNPIELGVDAALAIGLDEPRVTTIAIPIQRFRAGFFTSPTRSFEPWLAVNFAAVQGGGTSSTINLGLGVLFHLSPDRTRTQTYMRPFGGFTSFSNGASDTQATVGFGVGFKNPFANRRLATRLEAFLSHVFNDPNDFTSVGLLFGLSYFTR
jgi:hypothetical protein